MLNSILIDPINANDQEIDRVVALSNSVPDKKPMSRAVKGLLIALAVVVVLAEVAAAIVFTGGLGLLGVPLLGKAVGLMIGGLAQVGVTSAAMHAAAHGAAAFAAGVPAAVGQAAVSLGNTAAQGYNSSVGVRLATAAVAAVGIYAAAFQFCVVPEDKLKKLKVKAEKPHAEIEVFKSALDKLRNLATSQAQENEIKPTLTNNKTPTGHGG